MPRLTCSFCPFVVETEEESVIRAYRCHVRAHEREEAFRERLKLKVASLSRSNFRFYFAGDPASEVDDPEPEE